MNMANAHDNISIILNTIVIAIRIYDTNILKLLLSYINIYYFMTFINVCLFYLLGN